MVFVLYFLMHGTLVFSHSTVFLTEVPENIYKMEDTPISTILGCHQESDAAP